MSKAKTLNKRRYRPVSEIDDATLASKREYWRTRKREQRAKMSLAKESPKSPLKGICKPVFTHSVLTNENVANISQSQFGSTLLSNAGSYQTGVTQPNSSCHLTPEISFKTEISQKETLCEKITLNKVVHQFPEGSTDSKNCMITFKNHKKDLTTEESNMAASIVKISGVPRNKGLPMPRANIKVHVNTTGTRTQNRSVFNGNFLDISQQNTVSRFSPVCNQQRKPQIKNCLPPRSSDFQEHIVKKYQQIHGVRSANLNSKSYAYIQHRSKARGKTADMHMTEEEKAAKRRENWRIKKREQRAKRAEKLKMDKVRAQGFEKGQQETRKLSCVAPTHSLSSVNAMALRKARQSNSVKSVDLAPSDGKPVHFAVKVESDILSPPPPPPRYHSAKVNSTPGSIAKNLSLVSANRTNHPQHSKPNYLSMSSGVSLQPSSAPQVTIQSRIEQQKMMLSQRRQRLPQRYDRMETAEEQHAKKREYWRIKKRLQRAKLSLEGKARLKERETLKRCAVRFQSNLEQMRKAQTGFQRVPQPNRNMLSNASQTIRGFNRQDSTVSVPNSKTSRINLPDTSCCLHAVKTSYSTTSSSLQSQKLTCVRPRSGMNGIPNNIRSAVNIHLRSTGQNMSTANPPVRTKLSSSAEDTVVVKGLMEGTKSEKLTETDKRACRMDTTSSDSTSAVTISVDKVPHATIKQEPSFPSIETVYSLAEPSQSKDIEDIKPAPSPPQAKVEKEASSVDSQSTTLLVVASMKKLLEESLSSVAETNTSPSGHDVFLPCKTEEEPSPEETETCIKPELSTHCGEVECNLSGYANPSTEVKRSPPLCHSPPQAPDFSAEDVTLSCQGSLIQVPPTVATKRSGFIQGLDEERHDLSMVDVVRSFHRSTQEHGGKTAGPHRCCPPQAFGGPQLNEHSELERKREYWRTIKRRERARKAKEKPVQRKCINSQVHHPPLANPASHANLNYHAASTTVASLRSSRLVLSPTASNQQSSNMERQQSTLSETSQVLNWQLQAIAPTLSTRPATVTLAQKNHIKLSGPQMQTRGSFMSSLKKNPSQFKAATDQGQDQEEMIRRRRMHWRIKKQEQRARKAAREKQLSHHTTVSHFGVSCTKNVTELVQSAQAERSNYIPEQCQATSLKDDGELCYVPDDNCSDEPLSEANWRSTYLMDYDPINQLLVCMVCGEQQYCLSAEGVQSHIEEAHPSSLFLEETERQGILQAWDEQVAVRERFFTNQLWQQSDPPKEQSSTHTAEIEVILDADDTRKTKT